MVPRIVDVCQNGKFISKRLGFLSISDSKRKDEVAIDDVAVLMLSGYGATLTKDALTSLAEKGSVTILCGEKCLPTAYVVPLRSNYEMAQRTKYQIAASKPLNKRLWQVIIRKKLANQAELLESQNAEKDATKIREYMRTVQSGDITNREASGARIYWQSLLGKDFRRDPDGNWPNALLNYGYTILRAASLRAICAVGLSPSFGIHHANPNNAYALADDLMEVYRPLVDWYVLQTLKDGSTEMNHAAKEGVTRFIWADLSYDKITTPFHQALERLAYSLVQSYKLKKVCLEIADLPKVINVND